MVSELLSSTCLYQTKDLFKLLGFAMMAAFIAVAFVDPRFIKDYYFFRWRPFSVKRYGLAAYVSMASIACIVFILGKAALCN
jgi:hypothetical protein